MEHTTDVYNNIHDDDISRSKLHIAVIKQNFRELKRILIEESDLKYVCCIDSKGYTALHYASTEGYLNGVIELVTKFPNRIHIDKKSNFGKGPTAFELASCDEVKCLLCPIGETPTLSSEFKKKTASISICVVGAGMSGITSACQLASCGFNVTLLEARKRIGGRSFTMQLSIPDSIKQNNNSKIDDNDDDNDDDNEYVPIDLGGMWLDGPKGNPMIQLLEKFAISTGISTVAKKKGRYRRPFGALVYDQTGICLSKEATSEYREAKLIYALMMDFIKERRFELKQNGKDESMAESVSIIQSNLGKSPLDTKTLKGRIMTLLYSGIEQYYAGTFEELSNRWMHDEEESDLKGGELHVADGYGTLAIHLAKLFVNNYDCGKLLLEKEVCKIEYDSSNIEYNSSLITSNYDSMKEPEDTVPISIIPFLINDDDKRKRTATITLSSGEQFVSDFVICTLPLGILQNNIPDTTMSDDISISEDTTTTCYCPKFVPELPKWKKKSISKLGFGLMNKIVLVFDEIFWPEDVLVLKYASNERGAFRFFYTMHYSLNAPILMCLITNEYAKKMELLSDDDIVEEALNVLRTMFGSSVTKLKKHVITRWMSDPYSKGSYSFIKIGATGQDYNWMKTPVGTNLLFAGEATNRQYPGLVDGALRSGYRESLRIKTIFLKENMTTFSPLSSSSS